MTSHPINQPVMKNVTFLLIVFSFLAIQNVLPQDTLILQPGPEGKDACIASAFPESNFGTTFQFNVMAWTFSGEPGINRSLIEFDLSVIPPGSEILDAKLNLYYVGVPPDYLPQTGDNESYLQLITEEWDEGTVTWNNRPAVTSEDQVYLPTSTEPEQDYTNIDVTDPVTKMYNDPGSYHGLMFRLITEEYYRCLIFASTDRMENPELRPKLVVIYRTCNAPVPFFTFSIVDQTVNFTGISETAETWFWDFGDGYSSTLENPFHEYQEEGFYDICLTVSDSCATGQYCETIHVCNLPESGFVFHSEGLAVNFQDTSHLADLFYWSFGDGYLSELQAPSHTYDTAGNYQVCLETRNDCGSDTVCQTVFVEYSGITDPECPVISLFPNPIKNEVHIKTGYDGSVRITLLNLNGKEVLIRNVNISPDETIKIDVSQIGPGLYIFRIDSGDKRGYKKMMIVR